LALGLACAAVGLTLAFEWKMKRMIRREPASEQGFVNIQTE
jgi:MATE family multidrug resistance protein